MSQINHFIDLNDVPAVHLKKMVEIAGWMKAHRTTYEKPLTGKTLVMIFEKNSTRTRMSFELAMVELGGYVMSYSADQLQLGRGETIADTARVISRYADAIVLRTDDHEKLEALARHATIPIINGLSNLSHPCQIMADMLTIEERLGGIKGKTLAWVGDCNNVAASLMQAAELFEFHLNIASPPLLEVEHPEQIQKNTNNIRFYHDPKEAVKHVDVVITDTWISMADENKDAAMRKEALKPYQVNGELMALAKPDAIFMHCLPAHRGEEVTDEVIDGPHSVVWDEAENRLHAQKAVLLWCLGHDV